MKKLTIEEKAQRYDEAIEAALCIYNNMKDGGNFGGMEDLEVIFPELAESEDEKIRKEIISAINIYCSEYSRGSKVRNDMLTWLEKQGEQKPANWSKEDEHEVAILEAYIRSNDWSEAHINRALGIVDELVNKVKSIKPQQTWKPTEEQMKQLGWIAKQNKDNMIGKELMTLYQDLKKLKE